MKKLILIAAIGLSSIGTVSLAGDNATVGVSGNVVGTCKFNSGGSVAFTLDPTSGANASGTIVQPQFWCTRGATWTLTDDDGLHDIVAGVHRMRHATVLTEYIPYAFAYTATGTGAGKTNPINMNITSSVLNADFINALAGSYADTVIVTIAP